MFKIPLDFPCFAFNFCFKGLIRVNVSGIRSDLLSDFTVGTSDQQRRANLDIRTPAAALGFGDPLVANGERRQSPVLWGLLFQAEYHHWLTGSDIGSSHPYIDMKRQLLPDLGVTGPAAWIPKFAFGLFESEMNRIHRLHKPGPLTRQVINEEDLTNSPAHFLQRLFGRNIRAEVVEEQRGTDHSASQG